MRESVAGGDRDLLAEAALAGDQAATGRLIERLAAELLPFASALTCGSAEADVLVGDTLSRIHERLRQLEDPAAVSAWARTILLRRFLDHRRWQLRRREVRLESVALTGAPITSPELIDLRAALSGLDRKSRALVVLHYWRGLTLDETAAELGIPVGTVRSRLARILAKLRRTLGGDS
jgi:RNA polymerase sigma factor (sigma-70 family)